MLGFANHCNYHFVTDKPQSGQNETHKESLRFAQVVVSSRRVFKGHAANLIGSAESIPQPLVELSSNAIY